MARDGAGVRLTDEALAALSAGPGRGRRAGRRRRPRRTASPPASARSPPGTSRPSCAPSCSARWSARTRPGSGPEVEREVVRALMLLRLSTLATGHTGVRPRDRAADGRPAHRRDHAGGARVRLARLLRRPGAARALRARADGRGRGPRRRRRGCCPPPRPWPPPGWRPVELAAKEGLALINGTDGMLGMLVLAHHRPADAAAHRRRRRRDVASRASSAPTGSSPPSCRRSGRTRARRCRPPTWSRCCADSGVVACHRGPDCNRVQDAYSLRCSPQVHGAARDTVEHAAAGRRPRAGRGRRQPGRARATGRVESNGNFHGAPVAYVLDFLAIVGGRRRRRSASGAPTGSSTRPATTACRRSWPTTPGVDSGHMIAQYTQAAIVSELKRLAVPGAASTRSPPARCRRTTSRWAGRPPASCAARSTG